VDDVHPSTAPARANTKGSADESPHPSAKQAFEEQYNKLPEELRAVLNKDEVVRIGNALRELNGESPNIDGVLSKLNGVNGVDVRVLSQETAVGLRLVNPDTSTTKGFYAGNPGRAFLDDGGNSFVGIHDELISKAKGGAEVTTQYYQTPEGLVPIARAPAAQKLGNELIHELSTDLVQRLKLPKTVGNVETLEEVLRRLSE
jgi:hypothetical protein